MKKIYFSLVALLMFVAMPSMAQLDELSGKVIALGSAATEITENQWYVMQNGGRGAYAYENESQALMAMATSGVSLSGALATEYAGYLVRFVPVDGQDGSYYMQTGYGNYWGELTNGSNNGTTSDAEKYFVSGKISGYDNWFDFMGNNGEMVLDCNAAGSTVAGWGTDLPTSTSSNAAWQILPVTLTSESEMCTATITYNYIYGGEIVYTYVQTQRGPKTGFEVVFDGPAERYGVTCSDETAESETITKDEEFEIEYEYTDDTSATMPFKTTTITDGAFAEGTKWYYLSPFTGETNYSYTNDEYDYVYYKSLSNHPIDLHYMFAFTGNPFAGYKIYNYKKGAETCLDGSGYVVFTETGATYYLKEGYYYKGYSFNLSTNEDSYLNAYSNYLTIYTWADGWAWSDEGSAYDITEVTDEELAQAIAGVLGYEVSPEDGNVFRDEAMDAVQITFAPEGGDDEVEIASGMEEGQITLTDTDGNVVATPAYEIDADATTTLDIIFDPEFQTEGKYYLNIPANLVKGTTSGLPNAAIQLTYTFMPAFEEKTVTARIWKTFTYGSYTYTNWPYFTYPSHEDGDYYTCKVRVTSQDEFSLLDWENTGDESNALKLSWDISTGKGLKVNDTAPDSYSTVWVDAKTLVDNGYYGAYFYPTDSWASFNGSYGATLMKFYSYQDNADYYVCADWYMDDRYAADNITAKVYKYAFTDLGYDNTEYPSYTQLPYDSETNYYEAKVVAWSEDSLTIQNYDGQNSISLKLEDGAIAKVNGETADATYGTVWVSSKVIDGRYSGWYCFPEESVISYDPETKSGYIILAGLDYSVSEDGEYRYIYIGIGDYEPELDVPTVIKGDVNGDGEVNVADITSVLAVMYETDLTHAATADVNGDGEVNVADITSVLNIMYKTEE